MSFKLDHIVIAVHDLDTAIHDYRTLGFNVLPGGDHPGRATHNALVVFEDGVYFELIAWKRPAPEERWWQLLQRRGEGIVDYALLPSDTLQAVASASLRGLMLEGPIDGGRLRPDGERLRWQTARPRSSDLPFLCGDLTPRALRVPEGDARVHPNGVLGVASLSVAVDDVDATLARFRALLGPNAEDACTHVGEAVSLPAAGARVALLTLGSNVLVLSAPRLLREDGRAQGLPLAQQLATRGQGPYALVLQAGGGAAGLLDQSRTHGAAIELDPALRELHAQFRANVVEASQAVSVHRTVGG